MLVDEAPGVVDLDGGEPFRKGRAALELRVDRELAVGVDVARAAADGHYGETVGKCRRLFELRRDLHLSAAVDVSPAAVLPDQEKPALLLPGPGRLDPAAGS